MHTKKKEYSDEVEYRRFAPSPVSVPLETWETEDTEPGEPESSEEDLDTLTDDEGATVALDKGADEDTISDKSDDLDILTDDKSTEHPKTGKTLEDNDESTGTIKASMLLSTGKTLYDNDKSTRAIKASMLLSICSLIIVLITSLWFGSHKRDASSSPSNLSAFQSIYDKTLEDSTASTVYTKEDPDPIEAYTPSHGVLLWENPDPSTSVLAR